MVRAVSDAVTATLNLAARSPSSAGGQARARPSQGATGDPTVAPPAPGGSPGATSPAKLGREGALAEVTVLTFGCRLNALESGQARAAAQAAGLQDAVIVNTCAVTGEAVRQARQAIRRAARERPDARIIVTGCAAQIDPAAFAAMPEVDLVVGNADKARPAAYAPRSPGAPRVRVADIMAVRAFAPHLAAVPQGRARAFVQVQTGCDHRCTFCVIPYGRGNSCSAPAGEVVDEVRRLTAAGYAEVVLTGVDVTSWGADLPGAPTFGQLVARILRLVPALPRLRLSSIDAAEIDADLLRCLGEEPRLMPHLHLSLQHGDDLILKRMRRRHSRSDAVRLVETVRRARPDTAFGADLIAGFPTENEAAFEATLRLVDDCGLAFVHAFPFSPRPGTPAARMPQLERAVVKARAERLRAKGAEALRLHLGAQVGRTVDAVVEAGGVARAPDFTEIAFAGEVGGIARLRLTGHDGRRMRGVSCASRPLLAGSAGLSPPASGGRLEGSASPPACGGRQAGASPPEGGAKAQPDWAEP